MKDRVRLKRDKIEGARLLQAMTRKDLGKAAQLSPPAVGNATSGRPVTLATARKIASALGMTPADIIVLQAEGDRQAVAV